MPGWSGEALGQAGAIYKRQWQADAKLADLENALTCYRMGYARAGDERQLYCGINAAFILDQLATVDQTERIAAAPQAKEFSRQARELRTEIAAALKGRTTLDKWDWATLAEAHFGLGDFDAAKAALQSYVDAGPQGWERESTASQFAELGRLLAFGLDPDDPRGHAQQFAHSSAADALRPLVPEGAEALLRRAYVGKVGLALSGGGFRASLYHIGVLAALAERDVLRGVEVLSCVSGGLDPRRLLLPARAPPAPGQGRRGDRAGRLRRAGGGRRPRLPRGGAAQPARADHRRRGRHVEDGRAVELLAHRPDRRALPGAHLPPRDPGAAAGLADDRPVRHPQGRRGRLLAPLRQLAARGEGAGAGAERHDAQHRPQLAVHGVVDGRAAGRLGREHRRQSAAAAHVLRRRAAGLPRSVAAAGAGGRRVGLRPGPLPARAPRGALSRPGRRAGRRRRPRQPGHGQPDRAGVRRDARQRRERADGRAARAGPGAAERGEPGVEHPGLPRARRPTRRPAGAPARRVAAPADGRPPEEGPARQAGGLGRVPGALPAGPRRAPGDAARALRDQRERAAGARRTSARTSTRSRTSRPTR